MNKTFFKQRPFALAGLLAIPLLICMIIMGNYFPRGQALGFSTFIIAFEFVSTTEEVRQLLAPLSPEQMARVDVGNYLDFAFMLFYSAFLFLFFREARTVFRLKWLVVGQVLAVIIFFGDLFENIQLLNITKAFQANPESLEIVPFLFKLQLFTWVKWLCLALSLLFASLGLLRGGGVAKTVAVVCVFPFLLSIFALVNGTAPWVNRFAMSIFGALPALIIATFFIRYEAVKGNR